MEENGILKENEKQANRVVAKVMRITFLIFTLIYALDIIGIFTVKLGIMTAAYIGGAVFLLMPTLFTNVFKLEKGYIKYLNVIFSILFVTLLCMTLTYHVVVIYVYPIAIASLYFSKKLSIMATGLTVAGVSVGQILAFFLKTLQDDNFTEWKKVIIFGVIPRAMALIAVAAIFTMLSGRTASLLSNLMGAKAQEEMLARMKQMKESATQTSETMVGMVAGLSQIVGNSLQANQKITGELEHLSESFGENARAVENADRRMQDITEQLAGLSSRNHQTSILTDQIGEKTQENQSRMQEVTSSMEQINESTEECRQIISNLGEESMKIIGIVQTITGISKQIGILALNATIEAARAGEHGSGFAVVAKEIQKLSEQTKNAVESIGEIVGAVVHHTEGAVEAMEQNVQYAKNGMESIRKANESSSMIAASNGELARQVYEIDRAAESIREKSGEASDDMRKISDNTQQNCRAAEQVTAATQENRVGTESLAEIVEHIKELSGHLNQVVQE